MARGGDTVSVDAEAARVIHRAGEMVALRDDDDLIRAEDVQRAVHALVGGKAGVVAEDVAGGNAAVCRAGLHGVDLVVAFAAVVAAHEDAVGHARFINAHAGENAVVQQLGGRTVPAQAAAEHEHAVDIFELGRFF